jgi:hypothetical protein
MPLQLARGSPVRSPPHWGPSTFTFAGLAHQATAANDSAAVYRAAMWAVVAVAAAVNYRHGSAGWQQPGLTGIVFATLSVGSVAGWELRERQAYRIQIDDRLPARRPRFGYARWIRFPLTTGRALSSPSATVSPTPPPCSRSPRPNNVRPRRSKANRRSARGGRTPQHR